MLRTAIISILIAVLDASRVRNWPRLGWRPAPTNTENYVFLNVFQLASAGDLAKGVVHGSASASAAAGQTTARVASRASARAQASIAGPPQPYYHAQAPRAYYAGAPRRVQGYSLAETDLNSSIIYHSEATFCPKRAFSVEQQMYLDQQILNGYVEIEEKWWRQVRVGCNTITFGGGDSSRSCSGVNVYPTTMNATSRGPYEDAQKYLYGTSEHDARSSYGEMCKCGDKWTSNSYSLPFKNCNVFSSSVLKCVLGLSNKQPFPFFNSLSSAQCCDQ